MLLISLLILTTFASAQTSTAESELLSLTGSIRPDSVLYGLDIALTDLQISFTTNKAAKAQLLVDVANERLAEKTLMRLQGKNKESDEAERDEVKKNIEAEQVLASATPEELKRDVDKYDLVRVKLEQRTVVLNRVIEKIQNDDNPSNDGAIEGLQNALLRGKTSTEKLSKDVTTARIGGIVAPGTNGCPSGNMGCQVNNRGVYG